MSSDATLKSVEADVHHLLNQYQEYLAVSQAIDRLKDQQIKLAIELGANKSVPFSVVLHEQPTEIRAIGDDIQAAEQDLQRISDEMTFANPVVWIMYKYKAYLGTSQAIADMADFRKHCSKPGYICTKRYQFLNKHLQSQGMSLDDVALYPDKTNLPEVYQLPTLLNLLHNENFMAEWNKYEFNLENDRVAKWENVPA